MKKQSKSKQLQVRVSPAQKAAIRRHAKHAGMPMSEWVLAQLLPAASDRFQAITGELAETQEPSYALAELNDLLTDLTTSEYQQALSERPRARLSPLWECYIAAMIEYAGAKKGTAPPDWTRGVPPLDEPFFASSLPALRVHLMMHSPPPFHRRNIFIDSSVGDRVQMTTSFTKQDIEQLLTLLNDELAKDGVSAKVHLVGGAVMCLAFDARRSTKDLDAYFLPSTKVREAAGRVAARKEIDEGWLNDGVKGYLSNHAQFDSYMEMGNLEVFVAHPETMLAMKCLAMRLGAEFRDEDDIRYLLRHLGISTYDRAREVITKYYPLEKFPQKALYALEEILGRSEE